MIRDSYQYEKAKRQLSSFESQLANVKSKPLELDKSDVIVGGIIGVIVAWFVSIEFGMALAVGAFIASVVIYCIIKNLNNKKYDKDSIEDLTVLCERYRAAIKDYEDRNRGQ